MVAASSPASGNDDNKTRRLKEIQAEQKKTRHRLVVFVFIADDRAELQDDIQEAHQEDLCRPRSRRNRWGVQESDQLQ
eukprot:g21007.t1